MTERNSNIQPFKNRLFQIFNASSSGDDPQRREAYQQQKPKKAKTKELEDNWEKESQSFFDDFISLDEEKITARLSKEKAKKAFDRKFRQSSKSQQSLLETVALENAFETDIPRETTERKLQLTAEFINELDALFTHRLKAIYGHFDLFSLSTLRLLHANGFHDKFIQNLLFISYFHAYQEELIHNPKALLSIQLAHQFLGIPQKLSDLDIYLEKHCVDLFSYESLLNQTHHYIERNLESFESINQRIQILSQEVMGFFLARLRHPHLKLEKKLARYYLKFRYQSLKDQMLKIKQDLASDIPHPLSEYSGLIREWKSIQYNLSAVQVLTQLSKSGYPLEQDHLENYLTSFGIDLNVSEVQRCLRGFSLEDLEQIKTHLERAKTSKPQLHFYPKNSLLSSETQKSIFKNELEYVDQWSVFKAQYMEILKKEILFSTLKMYEDSFKKEGALPPESSIPLAPLTPLS